MTWYTTVVGVADIRGARTAYYSNAVALARLAASPYGRRGCRQPLREPAFRMGTQRGPMQARLFVGNLGWNVSETDLAQLAAPHGEVLDTKVITDRDTGRSRGFGFMTIETDNVQDVIRALDGQELDGRAIRVNEAEERPQRNGGSSGGRSRRDRY